MNDKSQGCLHSRSGSRNGKVRINCTHTHNYAQVLSNAKEQPELISNKPDDVMTVKSGTKHRPNPSATTKPYS